VIEEDGLEQFADLPGEQWEPSNGTEGAAMIESQCCFCERDKLMNGTATQEQCDADPSLYCEILNASFRGEAKEWREIDGVVQCIAFVKQGDKLPERCPHTMELELDGGVKP